MADRKWVYLMYTLGGLVLAYLLIKVGEWGWTYYGSKSNTLLINAVAFAVAGAATVIAVKNERVFTLATEVTTELKKVTWPDRKETFSSTIVVIVTTIVSSAILGIFDSVWGWLTRLLFNG